MGAILDRFNDLRNPELTIDVVRPELIEFTVDVSAAGVATDSGVRQTLKNYVFTIYGAQAWVKGGTVPGDAAPSLITVNFKEDGRGQAILKEAINLQGYVEGQEVSWFMPYRCLPGTDLTALWTVSTAWVAEINAARTFGIRLVADYYLCR